MRGGFAYLREGILQALASIGLAKTLEHTKLLKHVDHFVFVNVIALVLVVPAR